MIGSSCTNATTSTSCLTRVDEVLVRAMAQLSPNCLRHCAISFRDGGRLSRSSSVQRVSASEPLLTCRLRIPKRVPMSGRPCTQARTRSNGCHAGSSNFEACSGLKSGEQGLKTPPSLAARRPTCAPAHAHDPAAPRSARMPGRTLDPIHFLEDYANQLRPVPTRTVSSSSLVVDHPTSTR